MERYSVNINRKTQFCHDASFSQLELQIQGNPNQNRSSYFVDTGKMILKFIWRGKRPRIANTILTEKNKVKGLTLLDFQTYCKATVIKTVWYW